MGRFVKTYAYKCAKGHETLAEIPATGPRVEKIGCDLCDRMARLCPEVEAPKKRVGGR